MSIYYVLKHLTSVCVRIPRLDLSPKQISLLKKKKKRTKKNRKKMTPRPLFLDSIDGVEQHVTIPDWNQPGKMRTVPIKLFNNAYLKYESVNGLPFASWPQFSSLPTELRIKIWRSTLERYRMIDLVIYPAIQEPEDFDAASDTRSYTKRNELGRIISGDGYWLRLGYGQHPTVPSPLFAVNHEAREVALSFYRVRLPLPHPDGVDILYLNPDYDIIYLQQDWSGPPLSKTQHYRLFVAFLHDVKAYDPLDQG